MTGLRVPGSTGLSMQVGFGAANPVKYRGNSQ